MTLDWDPPPCLLVVEADEQARAMLAWTFESAGYSVWAAATGEGTVALLAHQGVEFDLVVLDNQVLDADGAPLLRGIRRYTSAPVLFVRSVPDAAGDVTTVRLGSDDAPDQPVVPRGLVARAEAILRRARRRRVSERPARRRDREAAKAETAW